MRLPKVRNQQETRPKDGIVLPSRANRQTNEKSCPSGKLIVEAKQSGDLMGSTHKRLGGHSLGTKHTHHLGGVAHSFARELR